MTNHRKKLHLASILAIALRGGPTSPQPKPKPKRTFNKRAPAIMELRKMTSLGFSAALHAIAETEPNDDPKIWARKAFDRLNEKNQG